MHMSPLLFKQSAGDLLNLVSPPLPLSLSPLSLSPLSLSLSLSLSFPLPLSPFSLSHVRNHTDHTEDNNVAKIKF